MKYPRQTYTRHDKHMTYLAFVMSYVDYFYGLSCPVFVCLGFVVSNVCLSRDFDITKVYPFSTYLKYLFCCQLPYEHQIVKKRMT